MHEYFGMNKEKNWNSNCKNKTANNQKTTKGKTLKSLEFLSFLLWHWPISTIRFQRQSVCMVCISLEPNSPLVTTGLTGFPESAKKMFLSLSICGCPLLSWGRICHGWLPLWQCYQALLHPEASPDPNIQNPFLTHRLHAGTSLAHWVISFAPEREEWEWRALCVLSSSETRVLLIICDHRLNVNMQQLIYNSYFSKVPHSVVCFLCWCFLLHFPFTAQLLLTFLHPHTLSFVVCVFWTEMEMENYLFSGDKMPKKVFVKK